MRKCILLVFILITKSVLLSQNILINQAGYKPDFPKFVFVSKAADSFYIHDAATGKIVFKNELKLWKKSDPSTGLDLYKGDFGSYKQQGTFYITTNKPDTSYRFNISDTVFNSVYNKTLKSFYLQRCGTVLLKTHSGVYEHPECHTLTDGMFHPSTRVTGSKDVKGGWHDAGDYGKYVINAGISVGTLLMAYEMFPERFNQDNLNIPESGNKIPDILDEVKFELDWLFTMQDTNGGVFAKVTRMGFEGFVMPQDDRGQRYIYQISSAATADFAAMMARAYRNFMKFDSAYAMKCLNAAETAWLYLEKNPEIVPAGGFKNPPDTYTGTYGDSYDIDERTWAASELYITTGNEKYHNYFKANYKSRGIFLKSMGWPEVECMAHLTYIFGKQSSKDSEINKELLTGLEKYCKVLVARRNADGIHAVLEPEDYHWGSISGMLNKAVLLIAGYILNKDKIYFDTALDQLNFTLGVNVHNMSYITGIGSKSPMHPHHRPSGSDNIINPVPGLVIGGANRNLNDDQTLKKYYDNTTPPAVCYIDDVESFASNETCINWNAPLVFVTGFFNIIP